MLKILSGIIIFLSTLSVIIFALGLRVGPQIDTELVVKLPYSQSYVYSIFTEISKYPNRKKNLENLEVLEMSENNIIQWRENYTNGSWKEYRIIEKRSPVVFDYELYASSNNHTAKITTTFNESGDFTDIIMTEKGRLKNIFMRGLRFIIGDNYFLKNQIKWLRVSILDEQIYRK